MSEHSILSLQSQMGPEALSGITRPTDQTLVCTDPPLTNPPKGHDEEEDEEEHSCADANHRLVVSHSVGLGHEAQAPWTAVGSLATAHAITTKKPE